MVEGSNAVGPGFWSCVLHATLFPRFPDACDFVEYAATKWTIDVRIIVNGHCSAFCDLKTLGGLKGAERVIYWTEASRLPRLITACFSAGGISEAFEGISCVRSVLLFNPLISCSFVCQRRVVNKTVAAAPAAPYIARPMPVCTNSQHRPTLYYTSSTCHGQRYSSVGSGAHITLGGQSNRRAGDVQGTSTLAVHDSRFGIRPDRATCSVRYISRIVAGEASSSAKRQLAGVLV